MGPAFNAASTLGDMEAGKSSVHSGWEEGPRHWTASKVLSQRGRETLVPALIWEERRGLLEWSRNDMFFLEMDEGGGEEIEG